MSRAPDPRLQSARGFGSCVKYVLARRAVCFYVYTYIYSISLTSTIVICVGQCSRTLVECARTLLASLCCVQSCMVQAAVQYIGERAPRATLERANFGGGSLCVRCTQLNTHTATQSASRAYTTHTLAHTHRRSIARGHTHAHAQATRRILTPHALSAPSVGQQPRTCVFVRAVKHRAPRHPYASAAENRKKHLHLYNNTHVTYTCVLPLARAPFANRKKQ